MNESLRKNDDYRQCTLEVYLLPRMDWADVLQLQHRFAYEIGDDPGKRAALIIVEHPAIVTVGRQGSHAHFRIDETELSDREIEVRWTNRGGGCWLHGPGSIAVYPIVPIRLNSLGLTGYREAIELALRRTLAEFLPTGDGRLDERGLTVGGRPIGGLGIAVKNNVAYHGGWINASLAPKWFDWLQVEPQNQKPMTSIARERRTPIRPDGVREAIVRNVVDVLGFGNFFLANAPQPSHRTRQPTHARI